MSRQTSAASVFNPEIATWTGPLGIPDFAPIDDRDFEATFDSALPAHLADIDAIAANA